MASTLPSILLVDDDPLVRAMTAELLREDTGFDIFEASDGFEALTVLRVVPDVALVITDVQMPGGLDGYGLAKEVRQLWPTVGVILLSGQQYPGPGDIPKGAVFLAKPYLTSALVEAVNQLTGYSPSPERSGQR